MAIFLVVLAYPVNLGAAEDLNCERDSGDLAYPGAWILPKWANEKVVESRADDILLPER